MVSLRLLERLAELDLSDDMRRIQKKDGKLYRSVHLHLSRLFNTRLGSVETDAAYGLSGLTTMISASKSPDVSLLAKTMLGQINQYESRLEKPTVHIELANGDNLSTRFYITGFIKENNTNTEVSINGSILANGCLQFDTID